MEDRKAVLTLDTAFMRGFAGGGRNDREIIVGVRSDMVCVLEKATMRGFNGGGKGRRRRSHCVLEVRVIVCVKTDMVCVLEERSSFMKITMCLTKGYHSVC